jgi:hypothetical protein
MGEIKDVLIAVLVVGTLGHIAGDLIQYLSGGSVWLPNGHESGLFWAAAYWFSRHPIWEHR